MFALLSTVSFPQPSGESESKPPDATIRYSRAGPIWLIMNNAILWYSNYVQQMRHLFNAEPGDARFRWLRTE